MKRILPHSILVLLLIFVLISIFTAIDSRQYMLEGFTPDATSGSSNLMLFHADWCGHCKKMKPDWEKVKKEFPGRCSDVESANITQEHRDKYNINGYPSIFIIKEDKVEEWKKGRTYDDFKTFLQSN